ncbi:MAG: SRPBCC domain-containing protein [Bacteroidetes bacterium]|nr:SRPBCC domain-containing protein [Bacteroidota bacterium]
MDNFNWSQFTKRIQIKSDLATIYNSWTKSAELEKWFLSKAVYFDSNGKNISATENVSAGCKYEWNWFAQNYFESGKVITANGTDLFEFTFAGECKVQVKLSEVKNYVLVEITQKEIPLDNNSIQNIILGCAFVWTFYLINLKSVLEGGLDLRNKDSQMEGLVNN